jgi:hypothetical protein
MKHDDRNFRSLANDDHEPKAGPLNYAQLPPKGLGSRQIRPIKILPGDDGTPIRCEMSVANLPASDPAADALPPNYIHCDHWVFDKPEEAHGANIHRDVRALQDAMLVTERKRKKLNQGINHIMHKYLDKPPIKRDNIFIPVMDLLRGVTQEDIVTVTNAQEMNDRSKKNFGMLDTF